LPRPPKIATNISELLQISCRRISSATPIAARLRKKTKAWKIVCQRWRRRTRSLPLEHLGRETCEFLIIPYNEPSKDYAALTNLVLKQLVNYCLIVDDFALRLFLEYCHH